MFKWQFRGPLLVFAQGTSLRRRVAYSLALVRVILIPVLLLAIYYLFSMGAIVDRIATVDARLGHSPNKLPSNVRSPPHRAHLLSYSGSGRPASQPRIDWPRQAEFGANSGIGAPGPDGHRHRFGRRASLPAAVYRGGSASPTSRTDGY